MSRQPHARPLWEIEADEEPESLAIALLGIACIVVVMVLCFVILPLLEVGAP